jgi:hypothetical protein
MPDMRDRKVWKVWGWEVWPPEDYDAIYKIAQEENVLIVVVHTIAKYKVCYYTGDYGYFFTFPPKFGIINIWVSKSESQLLKDVDTFHQIKHLAKCVLMQPQSL